MFLRDWEMQVVKAAQMPAVFFDLCIAGSISVWYSPIGYFDSLDWILEDQGHSSYVTFVVCSCSKEMFVDEYLMTFWHMVDDIDFITDTLQCFPRVGHDGETSPRQWTQCIQMDIESWYFNPPSQQCNDCWRNNQHVRMSNWKLVLCDTSVWYLLSLLLLVISVSLCFEQRFKKNQSIAFVSCGDGWEVSVKQGFPVLLDKTQSIHHRWGVLG